MKIRELGYLKRLHRLVIHEQKGSNKQYFLESKKVGALTEVEATLVCGPCFRPIRKGKNEKA